MKQPVSSTNSAPANLLDHFRCDRAAEIAEAVDAIFRQAGIFRENQHVQPAKFHKVAADPLLNRPHKLVHRKPRLGIAGMNDDDDIVQAVNKSLLGANLDPNQAIPFTPSPVPKPCPVPEGICQTAKGGNFTICRNMQLNQGVTSPPVCGEIISFQYPYQLVLPFSSLSKQTILLKAQVEMRSED